MKRRNFFGFAAGAAVAGPAMAKEAIGHVAAGLGSLNVQSGASGLLSGQLAGAPTQGYATDAIGKAVSELAYAKDGMAKLANLTVAQRARYKKQMHISQLDPDIAGYRSLSLSAKIDWQRERQLDAQISERKTMWQRILDGVPGWNGDDYLP